MDWKEWIGKKVFIKLIDGTIFSKSIIKEVDDKFINLLDKYKNPATISISQIIKIVEEEG